MARIFSLTRLALACAITAAIAVHPALAAKPEWAGGGKKHEDRGSKHSEGKGEQSEHDRAQRGRTHFEDQHRVVVRDYYVKEHRAGHCPPGLAKKHNGCMPPGQAKKWRIGRPLPRDAIFHNLPPPLVMQIGVPPSGYRYVRIASDILMIAIGTGLVVDAIQDLGRM